MDSQAGTTGTDTEPPIGVDAAADRTSGRRRSALHLLASSLFLLRLGSTMTAVGLPLMVLRRYHAGLDAGVTLALELLPNVVFGPVIGDAVDRSDPRRLAIAGPLLSAPAVALLSVTTVIWQVQALALVSGIGYMVGVPARMALRSQVIAKGGETTGNGILVASLRLPALIGPALAAVLVPHGYAVLFLTDGVSAVLAAVLRVRIPRRAAAAPAPDAADGPRGAVRTIARAMRRLVRESLPDLARVVAADRALAALTITAFTYMFAYGMTRLFLASYAVGRFPHDSGFFGLLTAAMGAGAVAGSLVTGRFGRFPPGPLYVVVNVVEGCCWVTIQVVLRELVRA